MKNENKIIKSRYLGRKVVWNNKTSSLKFSFKSLRAIHEYVGMLTKNKYYKLSLLLYGDGYLVLTIFIKNRNLLETNCELNQKL